MPIEMNNMRNILYILTFYAILSLQDGTEKAADFHTSHCDYLYNYLQGNCPPEIMPIDSYYSLRGMPTIDSTHIIYQELSRALDLERPEIIIMGWAKTSDALLVELYAEDLTHIGFYMVLVDSNCKIIDYLYQEEPINGDILDKTENGTIEWHYNAGYRLSNDKIRLEITSVDVLQTNTNTMDTLFIKQLRVDYSFDGITGFGETSRDSTIIGTPY